jgi:hypothetical protein
VGSRLWQIVRGSPISRIPTPDDSRCDARAVSRRASVGVVKSVLKSSCVGKIVGKKQIRN